MNGVHDVRFEFNNSLFWNCVYIITLSHYSLNCFGLKSTEGALALVWGMGGGAMFDSLASSRVEWVSNRMEEDYHHTNLLNLS